MRIRGHGKAGQPVEADRAGEPVAAVSVGVLGAIPAMGADHKDAELTKAAPRSDINDLYVQAAFVFRGGVEASLYLNGELLDREATPITLQNIDDVNNWFGLSQWKKDHGYQRSYDEVRVYDSALNGCQLKTLILRGPDRPFP